jgi:hypothetical protein
LEAKKRYFAANAKYGAYKRNPSLPTQKVYPSLQAAGRARKAFLPRQNLDSLDWRINMTDFSKNIVRHNQESPLKGAAGYEPFIRKLNINISKYNLLATQASKKPGKRGGGKNSTKGGSHEQG